MRVLVIEDDAQTAAYMVKGLSEAGHTVDHAPNGRDGLFLGTSGDYDAMIVDRMLPGLDGIAVIQALRAANVTAPILILSALGQVDERVAGLKSGADDYLTKPFAFSELVARLEALTRRRAPSAAETRLTVGDLEMVVTRTMLLEGVWDYHFDPQTNVIDVHISRLRQKIDKGFATPLLHTRRGAGYCLSADS